MEELLLLDNVDHLVGLSKLWRWVRQRRLAHSKLECTLLLDDDVAGHRALLMQRRLVERLRGLRQNRVVFVELVCLRVSCRCLATRHK